MPEAAITPIVAPAPPPAVSGAQAKTGARSPADGTNAPPENGFAEALKRQLGGKQDADGTKSAKVPETEAANDQGQAVQAALPTDTGGIAALLPFAPPDLASLMPAMALPLTRTPLADSTRPASTPATDADGPSLGDLLDTSGQAAIGTGIGSSSPDSPRPLAELQASLRQEGAAAPAADFAVAGKSVPDGTRLAAMNSGPVVAEDGKEPGKPDFQAPLAALQQAAQPQRQEAAATAPTPLNTPVGAPGWSEDVGNKLVWMTGQGQQKAELVLTPAHLGRIEVSITVANDQATANFVAASSEARDALEQSLPKLREMFANAGISLGQANVSAGSSSGQQFSQEGRSGGRRYGGADAIAAIGTSAPLLAQRSGLGMVDTFA